MTDQGTAFGIRARLRTTLTAAMKERDMATVRVVRSAIGAIDNAEAVDTSVSADRIDGDSHIAGATAGAGSSDVRRRELTDDNIVALLQTEIVDRRTAAAEYDTTGAPGADRAALLRSEADTLERLLQP
jgi:uncharacterized protein